MKFYLQSTKTIKTSLITASNRLEAMKTGLRKLGIRYNENASLVELVGLLKKNNHEVSI